MSKIEDLKKGRHELVERMKKELSRKWRFSERRFRRMNEKYDNLSVKIKQAQKDIDDDDIEEGHPRPL